MKIRNRFIISLLARVIVVGLRLLFLTCRRRTRLEVEGIDPTRDTGDRRYLYSIWHDQILLPIFLKPRNSAGLVSRHQDGSWVADLLRLTGIKPIRGSSRRGGTEAMRQMLDAARDLHIVITPDGPRGPRREMKPGIVFLASHSGRTIVPVTFSCRRAWRIRGNWTDLLIPKPFTRIYAIGGEPLQVPLDLSRAGLEQFTARLQAEMDRLQAEVDRWAAGDEPRTRQNDVRAAA
ncbi:MAG: lysophospholipid acyltransferase family protein [Planctomycetes bacterium]|nr:lysophospholipid acyltransferase family protein [Planctomycetota bacterium]